MQQDQSNSPSVYDIFIVSLFSLDHILYCSQQMSFDSNFYFLRSRTFRNSFIDKGNVRNLIENSPVPIQLIAIADFLSQKLNFLIVLKGHIHFFHVSFNFSNTYPEIRWDIPVENLLTGLYGPLYCHSELCVIFM